MSYGTVQAEKMTTESGYSLGAGNASSFKNRLINGAMMIDQRNAGAAVTINTTSVYTVDRWSASESGDAVFTVQQDTVAPTGFTNSAKITITTADASVGASQYNSFQQRIEGTNIADLMWGTANAKTVTLSFWVRSSVTGTFGGALDNSAYNRSYPFTYSISAANTWEQKTVTIPGDTSGTWLTTTGTGIQVYFDLGSGVDNTGTAGSWVGAGNVGADSTVQLVNTLNATWYITGVQLEVGTVATSFDFRSYGTELALCQRYYEKSFPIGTVPANGGSTTTLSTNDGSVSGLAQNRLNAGPTVQFKVTKRTAPTMTKFGNSGGDWIYGLQGSTALVGSANSGLIRISENAFTVDQQAIDATAIFILGHWTASAEL